MVGETELEKKFPFTLFPFTLICSCILVFDVFSECVDIDVQNRCLTHKEHNAKD